MSLNLDGPALAPPPGVVPDFDNPPNGNGRASAALIVMMVISTLCVILQAYGKCWLTKSVHLDDVLILIGYGNYWGCMWASYALTYTPGYFVHNWNLTLRETIAPYYLVFVFGVFYSVVLATCKIAILVGWCRVFVPPGLRSKSLFWWGSMSIIALQTSFGIAAIFLLTFQCVPHEAIWDFTITDKTCLPLNPLQITSSTVHLISDVGILLLPQKIIWGLNMSPQKRAGVALVFGFGALAVVCAVLRLKATIDFGASPDTMFNIGSVVLWATGEMSIGFFVVCVPHLPRVLKESYLFRQLRAALGWKSTAASSGAGKNSGLATYGGTGAKNSRNTASAYQELDEEDGLKMGRMKSFDSTERLRNGGDSGNGNGVGITRTTQITVTRGDSNEERMRPDGAPWLAAK